MEVTFNKTVFENMGVVKKRKNFKISWKISELKEFDLLDLSRFIRW